MIGIKTRKQINWKDILSDNYFDGLTDDLKKKEALNEWLIDGNFSCVKKDKYHLIKQYMTQEGIPYPSTNKIKYHKRKKAKEIILTSTLVVIMLVGLCFIFFEVLRADEYEAIEKLEYTNRTEVISNYLNAEPTNLLVEDSRSIMSNQYNGVSYVTFQGKKFYVEMQKNDNEKWEILKIVQLQ